MEKLQSILVIIPAHNEATHIGEVIRGVKEVLPSAQILVINDASTDNTSELSRDTGAKVISLPFNLGYGAALQTGFKFALSRGYDYLVQLDADGQHDPKD